MYFNQINKKAVLFLLLLSFYSMVGQVKNDNTPPYIPLDTEIYNTIVAQDQLFFKAYNHCDLDTQLKMYSDTIEFYHDKSGLTTSKDSILK